MTPLDWLLSRDTGISSETIVAVMTGSQISWANTPSDGADFGRCYRLLKHFPEWRTRLPEMVERFPKWAGLVAAWDELTAIYEEGCDADGRLPYYNVPGEVRRKSEAVGKRLYARMKEIEQAERDARAAEELARRN